MQDDCQQGINPKSAGQMPARWTRFQPVIDLATSFMMLFATAVLIWQYWPRSRPADLPLPKTPISIAGTASIGDARAEAIVMVFTDFECPYCAQFALGPVRQLSDTLIRDGKTAILIRHYPIEQIHTSAFPTAVAVECARQQDKFEEVHEFIFERQTMLKDMVADSFQLVVKAVGLDGVQFLGCINGSEAADRVRADLAQARRLGVAATPSVIVGRRVQGDRAQLVERVNGPLTAAAVGASVEEILAPHASGLEPRSLAAAIVVACAVTLVLWRRRAFRRRAQKG